MGTIQALLKCEAQVNSDGSDPAPLTCAAQRGHAGVVKLLLNHHADVNAKDSDGDTALHEAVYNKTTECARVLIYSNSIDLDTQNSSQWTPLMAAAPRDLVEIVSLLLQKKVSTNTRTIDGRSALHIAAEEGKVDVVRLLLQHGAPIDSVTKAKLTPLMLAAYRGHRETMKVLIESGASLTCKNKKDQNAATIAMLNSRTDVLDLLYLEDPEVTNAERKRR
ncbi:Ankyrin-1 [Phytophthora citrophthora]|uniref:Ankyrin-1 n=1 Tax=Phytophthora citrophthora TaxID=4793 RepID=A0AAD9LMY4_9STRA|nr:Ankyrin-1 [Phytophthora citrophthora]